MSKPCGAPAPSGRAYLSLTPGPRVRTTRIQGWHAASPSASKLGVSHLPPARTTAGSSGPMAASSLQPRAAGFKTEWRNVRVRVPHYPAYTGGAADFRKLYESIAELRDPARGAAVIVALSRESGLSNLDVLFLWRATRSRLSDQRCSSWADLLGMSD